MGRIVDCKSCIESKKSNEKTVNELGEYFEHGFSLSK